ncbi:[Ribulose-bisphosphate carboxylase]-lysine N-methyltransferase [Bertholletia excelsa]
MATATSRRLRAFKRWMRSQGIECSDALDFSHHEEEGISVRTLCDLHEGDLVATIPKQSCLTIKTSGARHLIEVAGLEGYLGLSVALMYEKSLGSQSPWFEYLHLCPQSECIPLLWTLEEIDSLLLGTELHKVVKEDKALVYEDWEECILPLIASAPLELNPDSFEVEQYFAAKSLLASRSFEIDDYHGFGMVPLADLFNHKTAAEDVHFTSTPYLVPESDDEVNCRIDEDENASNSEDIYKCDRYEGEQLIQDSPSEKGSSDGNNYSSSAAEDDPVVLEMIMVKDVRSGDEVFNTYGSLGNAALLHRYGFTEANNPYDIVNIDLDLVIQWCSSLFSSRHGRVRLSLWRRLNYSGCFSQYSEYFEISSNGEPQTELLTLLYIILLPDGAYSQLDLTVSTVDNLNAPLNVVLRKGGKVGLGQAQEMSEELLLTKNVRKALLSLADLRESFYGSNSIEEDVEVLHRCSPTKERKLYHSVMLRVSERRILQKLRTYAAGEGELSGTITRASKRKK